MLRSRRSTVPTSDGDAGSSRRECAARRWTLVVGAPLVAGFALLPLRDHMRNTNLALLLALVTVGISVLGGLAPGAVAGLVTALTYNVLFTRPYWSLRINDVDDVETVLLLSADRRRRGSARQLGPPSTTRGGPPGGVGPATSAPGRARLRQ